MSTREEIQTYSLNCDKCGDVFESSMAFPNPHICHKCSKREETDYETFKEELLKSPEVRKEYDKLNPKYDLIAKRLEIREGIEYYIRYANYDGNDEIREVALSAKILGYLHSQGVVIKVERELPDEVMYGQESYTKEDIKRFLDKAGYEAVEPLIEEQPTNKGIDGKPYIVGASGVGQVVKPLVEK